MKYEIFVIVPLKNCEKNIERCLKAIFNPIITPLNEYLDENGHQKAIISYPELTNEVGREVISFPKNYYLSPSYVLLAMRQALRKNPVAEVKRLSFSTKMCLGYAASQR